MVEKATNFADILQAWTSPFTGVAVVNNRQTPVHRDHGGFRESMDILASVGPYQGGQIDFPSLNLSFAYPPGTLVGLTGRLIPHGASADGERCCFAYYLKQAVVERVIGQKVDFINIRDIMPSPTVA